MRKLARFFSYTLSFIFNLLPWKLNQCLAQCLAFVWVDVLKIRKKVVFENIDMAFKGTVSDKQKHEWMKTSIFVLMKNVFDLLKVPYLTDQWINDNVVIEGTENIPRDHSGLLFLTLHMASGDLASTIVSRRIVPLSLISKRFSNAFVDEFWFSLRQRSLTQFIDAHAPTNAFDILKALKQKRGVVFVLDQYMGPPYGVPTEFFGIKTGTAYGLALFAKKTRKPVVPLYAYWSTDEKLHISIRPPVDLSSINRDDETTGNNLEQERIAITNLFNKELEAIIREHPEQWMWVHRRWKKF